MSEGNFIPYQKPHFTADEMQQRTFEFYQFMDRRRSVRHFSDQAVPQQVIQQIIMTASSAPSGAHQQPWTFCAISNPHLKKKIRKAAEKEEYENYHHRMSKEWLDALTPLGTDWRKPFLEIAPWLIVVFKKAYDLDENGNRKKNYYATESVGLASGFLLAAIHNAGLVSLTHTPSPMNFLQKILNRAENERPFLLVPVGYPADDAKVPNLKRKREQDVLVWY